MKNYIYIFFLTVSTFINAQTKESDYFRFYRGGEKYLKLIKYVYFDTTVSDNQMTNDGHKLYFYIDGQRFLHKKKYKIDTCSNTFLKKIKLSKPSNLQQETYEYYKIEKKEQEKKMNNGTLLLFPATGFHNYVKVYILKKVKTDKLLKYEVDWDDSVF